MCLNTPSNIMEIDKRAQGHLITFILIITSVYMMFPNPYVNHVGQQSSKSQGLGKGCVLAKCIKIWKIPFQIDNLGHLY